MRDVQAHWIRGNASARVPKRLVVFDTEANRLYQKDREVQTWSLAVARFMLWTNKGKVHQSQSRYETPQALWSAISEFTREKARTAVYCHNLGYDLRISKALSALPSMGWRIADLRMDSRGSWAKWKKEKTSLTLCDSASIWNVPLQSLASALGTAKLALPSSGDREALYQRCEQDVEILSTALLKYFTWLRTGECGNWAITGASQSWNHWRHSHYTHKLLVHDNQEALAAERRAMW